MPSGFSIKSVPQLAWAPCHLFPQGLCYMYSKQCLNKDSGLLTNVITFHLRKCLIFETKFLFGFFYFLFIF